MGIDVPREGSFPDSKADVQTLRFGSKRIPKGPLLSHIDDLDCPEVATEEVLPLAYARVIYVDYDLLQHDFDMLRPSAL